jgi:hypothetical protein
MTFCSLAICSSIKWRNGFTQQILTSDYRNSLSTNSMLQLFVTWTPIQWNCHISGHSDFPARAGSTATPAPADQTASESTKPPWLLRHYLPLRVLYNRIQGRLELFPGLLHSTLINSCSRACNKMWIHIPPFVTFSSNGSSRNRSGKDNLLQVNPRKTSLFRNSFFNRIVFYGSTTSLSDHS